MADVVREIEEMAQLEGAEKVVCVGVRLGSLSHFTPEHFREHFEDATRGTIAEGAEVDAVLDDDLTSLRARDVVLERLEVELPDPVEAR
jgi:hydrogenase nickel incorporation protein HypA/HybF